MIVMFSFYAELSILEGSELAVPFSPDEFLDFLLARLLVSAQAYNHVCVKVFLLL